MKKYIIKTIQVLICVFGIMIYNNCSKQDNFTLTNSVGPAALLSSPSGLDEICAGNMSLMKALLYFNGQQNGGNSSFFRQYWYSSEFPSDNVVYGQTTPDPLYMSFTYQHTPDQQDMSYFWWITYKIISSTNTVYDAYAGGSIPNLTPARLELIGENYFMRAFCYFSLLNFYAVQYNIDSTSLGVPLRITNQEPVILARKPVNAVYAQIIKDLNVASTLMTQATNRGVDYPSIGAVNALLSRVYLYMGNYNNAITYANKVINSGVYSITNTYPTYFANALTSSETIWCLNFTTSDLAQFGGGIFGMVGSMYYGINGSGWGQEYASDPLRAIYAARPYDNRRSYLDTVWNDTANHAEGIKLSTNAIREVWVTKFANQNGNPQLSSPVFLRISEAYLNRAEANAHLGNTTAALNDLDLLNENRGYSGGNLYLGVVPAGSSALNEVLIVRRLELSFEGFRKFDLLRNKLTLYRKYWGCHLLNFASLTVNYADTTFATDSSTVITYTDPRNIFYIPEQEIELNTACVQNPLQ